ncbi:MAG: serine/threonine protein kinase, partial [Planctomycetota bacterium]
TPGFFKRFLREAELGKQVNHENVVRTLDVDATMVEDKQVNYMVMEYVEGRSLRELLNDLGAVPESLLRELAQQTAAGLASIQSEGIIHRDLKPENILITDDHQVRIMDLGVAKLQEASVALTREGQFAGSFLYAAPEQFAGGVVGPASDLYSFGVILYELATGQNPFKQDDTGAVIHAHLHTVPARATERSPDLSPFLSELIAALLTKEQEGRPASAEFVCELLEQGESSDWWADRVTTLRAIETPLPKIRVRRDTEVHGRERELAQLNEAWERAKQGQGTTLFLEGEAGIGKTRLLDAFLKSLQGQDAHVLYGSYPPSGGLGGLSDAVIGKFGEAGLEQALEPYLTVTPSLVPAFASLIRHESPPTGVEPLQGDALQSVCCHLLRALAEEKPTIWIIEDLHFSPADSWNLLLALARSAGNQRNLIILSSRPGLSEDVLTHLSRLEEFERLNLERLGAREIIELLRDAFKSEALATKLGGTIAYKSDGVPFFIFELVRSLKDGSLLRREKDGTFVQTEVISDIQVPSAVKDLIESRLRGLSKEERAILDLGAVQGFEFDPDLVARVRGLKRIQVLETLADLERRAGIVRGGAGVCRFDQYQIHEVLLQNLMPDLQSEYHTLLAEEYAKREEIDEDTDVEGDEALFLATHYLQGSRPKAARPFLVKAMDRLTRANRVDQAIEMADRALRVKRLIPQEERADLLLR